LSANKSIAGWDIGGAHLKLAYVSHGELYVHQVHCPLWRGIHELNTVLNTLVHQLPSAINTHHVTMTGELVDCFSNRQEGVEEIINAFVENMPQAIKIFSKHGLYVPDEAKANYQNVASMNWMASAQVAAAHHDNAIFVDMGSTTTDILRIKKHTVVLEGETDHHRLITGELVYTGVVRSCVNTLCSEVPFNNTIVPLIAENFAVTADIYRILNLLPQHADLGDTMDNGPKDQLSSLKRLARMIGLDYSDQEFEHWKAVAEYLMQQQMNQIKTAITRLNHNVGSSLIVGAGVGSFLLEPIAQELDLSYQNFSHSVVPKNIQTPIHVNDCAPAVALVFHEFNSD